MAVDYTQMTNPMTGKPFESQEEGQKWSDMMSGAAATAGTDSGAAAASAKSLYGTGAGIDWSKTGWNIDYTGDHSGDSNWFQPGENMYGFQIGDLKGEFNPITGEIQTAGAPGSSLGGQGETYQYDAGTDYGLGSTALGIIPLEHDASGQVSVYVYPVKGGGFAKTSSFAEAQAGKADYDAWKATTKGAAPAPAPR